jgi:DNA modification methylase
VGGSPSVRSRTEIHYLISSSRGDKHVQRNQSLIACPSLRRGGFRVAGADEPLNPFEKPLESAAWAIQSFSDAMGTSYIYVFYTVIGCVLSFCAGSGTFMEAAIQLGRSCVAVDIDGTLFFFPSTLLFQKHSFEVHARGHNKSMMLQ